jgi:hypothetical protein
MKTAKACLFALGASLALTACSSRSSVDTATLELTFQAAEPALQSSAQKAISAIKSTDYADALTELKHLTKNRTLTPEQRGSIKSVMLRLERSITLAAHNAVPVNRLADQRQN